MPANVPSIVAHRGASKAARENTIEAFHLARTMGAAMVELDVRRTRDGALPVHHDAHIDGVAIVDCDVDALPAYVPMLDAALDACEGMEVNIEIKNNLGDPDHESTQIVASAVVALLRQRGDGARMLISSFDRPTINWIRANEPTLRTGFLIESLNEPVEPFCAGVAAEGHVAVHPRRNLVTPELCAAAHRHGLAVNAWTIDKPELMLTLADHGIDGLITNVPDVARETYAARA
jgi:glycerophosphoryl diester phosphodiesterase